MPYTDPNQQYSWPDWTNQHHQQLSAQSPENACLQSYAQTYQFDGYYGNFTPAAAPYIQPHYANTTPAPVIAELPAPMPPAPPTSTSKQQLNGDEIFAHKLQQLEIEVRRRRPSSNVSLQRRPISLAPASPSSLSPLTQQQSLQSLRPHAQSFSSVAPYSPGSLGSQLAPRSLDLFGPPSDQHSPSSLPEVVVEPYHVVNPLPEVVVPISHRTSLWDSTPIPVEKPTQMPVDISSNTSSLSAYLEKHYQVPYPLQWSLAPAMIIFHADIKPNPKTDWLDVPETVEWRIYRQTEQTNPSYTFKFKSKGGSFRDPHHSWTMTCSDPDLPTKKKHYPTWTYDLKLDLNTGMRKTEALSHGKQRAILTTYVHALNYDALRFIGPDGRAYMWVSQHPVSSIGGARWDTLRHALFVAGGNISDPLYGHIVADHTFWDGTGEEALCIRSLTVDPDLIVASLQVLKDWEKQTLREQKKRDSKAFQINEDAARRGALGKVRYWRAGDGEGKGEKDEKIGEEVKRKDSRKDSVKSASDSAGALGILAGAGLALAGSKGTGGRQSISGSSLAESR